jgi:ribonuclease P protein component
VARLGKRVGTASLEVRILETSMPNSRFGIVVPKYGHSAVRRNRLKRALRELTRMRLLTEFRAPDVRVVDVVMRARPNAYGASPEKLQGEFETLKKLLLRAVVGAAPDTPLRSGPQSAG